MSYCLNPNCPRPNSNSTSVKFCTGCGAKLLLAERYRAIKQIGQGGFGKTFLAIDEYKPSQPRCVIKQFLPQAQGTNNIEKATELFKVEATQLDELGRNHLQIPELLAYFTQDNQQYLVQEFIDGQNLADELENNGAFNENQIIALLNSLLPVLQFVHSKQVIHRDIKPENIIRRSNGDLVLVDFGAAKTVIPTALSVTGTVIGTAGYASPEQAIGKTSIASDIYSLGVTCLHLLTHIEPFDLFDITEGSWVWRDYLHTPISNNLGQVLDKMVEGAMKRRYQSADEVLQALSPPQPTVQAAVPNLDKKSLLTILTEYRGTEGYLLYPDISNKNQAEIRDKLRIPNDEEILAFIITTMWGRLHQGLAFTTKGIIWRTDTWIGNFVEYGNLPYKEFDKVLFTIEDESNNVLFRNKEGIPNIHSDKRTGINLSGWNQFKKKELVNLLNKIQNFYQS